jgi:hypothetical protein
MLFRVQIKTASMELQRVLGTRNILLAKNFIVSYPFGASERLLDAYLRTNVKKGLIECCLSILFNLTKSTSAGGEIIYTLTDDNLDTLAQLITCGVGNVPGSRILVDSISRCFG